MLLKSFENCEKIFGDYLQQPESAKLIENNSVNELAIHVKLANLYWTLGQDYYHLAVRSTDTAWQLCDKKEKLKSNYEYLMWNNLVWYHTELFRIADNPGAPIISAWQKKPIFLTSPILK
ncbi:MAG: hypothetical protein HQM03_14145, partial [Magnetococcales bacterium]|nr:hypothetical protein [Magnetococcales bacterium]